MPPKQDDIEKDKAIVILEKMLVFQLFNMNVPQERIAKIVGRKTAWVNSLLKGITRGGEANVSKKKTKKTK